MSSFNILKKSLAPSSPVNEAELKKAHGKLFLTTLVFASLMAMPFTSKAQYSETFLTANKGYLLSCANDLAGVNWTLSSWDATGTCQGGDLRDPNDYFQTNASGVLESIDLDQEVCWESPLMNISAAGTVSLSVALTWAGFDTDIAANNCSGDYIRVQYSVNGGAYTMVPNVAGGNACATVAYPFGAAGAPFTSSTTVTQGGISGTNLRIRVCVFTNANAEIVTIDNVSVPQAGVTLNCNQPVLSTTQKNIVCNGPNSGSIDLSVTGGTSPYTYSWTGGAITQDRTGITAGTYTVTVTDAASCTQTTMATITNSPIVQSGDTFPASCGQANGAIDLTVSGGNPGYTYAWTGGATTQDRTGVAAGTHTVTITDTSTPGCTSTASYVVGSVVDGPYNETFSTPNKGYLLNQVNDFLGMNWTLSPWTFDEPVTGIGRDNGDYFQTTAGGKLEIVDSDMDVCWISPEINTTGIGTFQFKADLSWTGLDNEDYINVQYSLNGGVFTTLPNQFGGGAGTIQYAFPAVDQAGSFTVTQAGLTANKVQIKICALANSQADVSQADSVRILDTGGAPVNVSLCFCPSIANKTATICGGSTFTVTPTSSGGDFVPTGTTYSWSAPVMAGITGTAAGSNAANISGTLTNTTNAPINVVYNVTTTSGTCPPGSFTVTVTVNPTPAIGAKTATICTGGTFTVTPTNGVGGDIVPAGTTYSWSAPAWQVSPERRQALVPANISGTLTNTTNAPINVVYTVTPSSPTTPPCPGSTFTVTVTVNPTLTLGNLVYKDNNINGIFDGGDMGINTVLVRLYLDDGDGVLDAGDGAAIATTNTANVSGQDGIYSFVVCPGNYIVEIAATNFNSGGPLYDGGLMTALLSSPVGGATDPDNDVNNDDNGDPVAGFGVASQAVTLAPGTEPTNDGDADNNTNLSVDFGFKTSTTLSINDVTQVETNAGMTTFSFTVSLSSPAGPGGVTFDIATQDNTATTANNDYAAKSLFSQTIPQGSSTYTFNVTVNGDLVVEDNETFFVNVTNVTGAGVTDGQGLGTINNDDAATLTLTGGISQNETNGGTVSHVFTATLSAAVQGGFTVAYTTNNGTATTPGDYTDNDGTLTFAGIIGETRTITVLAIGDITVELDETFTENLGAIGATTATQAAAITKPGSPQTGTITNDDAAVVSLAGNVSQAENLTPQVFTVNLSNAVDVAVTVVFSTLNGTATTADNDYTGIAGQTVTFPAGTTTAQTVNVTVNNDSKVEADEVFNVAIGMMSAGGRNVSLGTSTGTGTILNNDAATVTLSGSVSHPEGNTGTTAFAFTATLNNPVQGGFSLAYTTNDGTATTANNDYVDNDAALVFAGTANEMKTITVLANGDFIVENNETFTVALGAFSGLLVPPAQVTTVGSPATGTIQNDETDWGDAPTAAQSGFANSYPTTLADNGARHTALLGFSLGATADGEADGQPTSTANGDGADEDGVILPASLITGTSASIAVNSSIANAKLDAWVDFNRDGDWTDAGEQIFTTQNLAAGNNAFTFAVPGGASVGTSFARFRVSAAGGLLSTGVASTGEVEDYQVSILSNQFAVDNPSVIEGDAGTTNLVFTVSRTTNTGTSSVDYAVSAGTATLGTDYASNPSGTLNFTAGGALSQTVTVTVNGDLVVENNETVILTLSNPVGGGIGVSPGTGTINNDDLATLTLSTNGSSSNTEGSIFDYLVSINKAVQGGFTIAFNTNDGTATLANSDYTDNDNTLTFSGSANETQGFSVLSTSDNTVELDETFTTTLGTIGATSAVQIAAITKAGSPQTGTINNNDGAEVSIAGSVSQLEGLTPQTFTVTLSNPVDVAVTVQFSTANVTASTADNDYTGIVSQTVTFAANTTTSQTVPVTIINDNKVEGDEIYNVNIGGTLSASGRNVDIILSSANGIILNDDNATVTLTGTTSLAEGNTGQTPVVFTATLNNPVQSGFTLNYTTNDGTATTANNDYVDNDGSFAFTGTMGESHQITVQVNGDLNIEPNETFTVAINSLGFVTIVNPASVTIAGSPQTSTILNDELDWGDAPTATQSGFAGTYPTLSANNGARHALAVGGLRLGATVDADLDGQANATATGDGADEDGVTLPSALIINTTANITVNASGSGTLNAWVDFNRNGSWGDTGEKIFSDLSVSAGNNALSFAVPAGASLGTSYARFRLTTASGTQANDAAADGEVEDYQVNIANTQFSINDPVAINEGNASTTDLVFTVSRSNTSNACSVDFSVTGGTATVGDGDFTVFTPSPISFSAGGSSTASIIVRVNGDTKVELNETVEISLSNPVNGSILDGLGVGTINNDDAATLSITSPTVTEGDAGTQNMTFDLALSNPSDANVVVNFATINGSATTADVDYQSNSGSHTFLPGQTTKQVVVLITGDCKIEPNEQFTVQLSSLNANSRSVTLSGGGSTLSGTGTIVNNDAAPVITCPGPITISCTASQLPANTGMATATDNCAPITFGYTDVITPGSCAGNYTIARTWKATDNTNDMSTCVQTITVVDNTPPTPVCLSNTVFIGAGGTYTLQASDVLNMNATTDNCGTVSVFSITPATVTCAQLNQTINVVVVVKDDCGNSAQCTASITVQEDTDLPSGWNNGNVGNAGGSSIFSPCSGTNGGFVLTATGFSTSSSDVLHTAYQQICGNTEVIARVVSISGAGWGGVMIRENLMPGSKKVSMKTQLTTNIRREIRSVTNGAAAILNSIRPGHAWLRLVRTGSNIVGYSSVNGTTWDFAFSATVSMSGCVYVGIFSESINNSVTNTATFDNVSVTGAPVSLVGSFNQSPVAASGDQVQIYPNPTTGELNIDLDVHAGKPGVVQVFNVLGELVTQERLVAGEVEPLRTRITGSSGVYTVVIQLDDRRIVRRVVVDPGGGK